MYRGIVAEEHIHWILCLFTLAHIASVLLLPNESKNELDEEKAWKQYFVSIRNVIRVVNETCPGNVLHLLLAAWNFKCRRIFAVNGKTEEDVDGYFEIQSAEEEMKKACLCVYGQQKPEVVEAILTRYIQKSM